MKDRILTDQPTTNYTKVMQLNKFMIGHAGYIAGGVFKNIFNEEYIQDVDIFFEKSQDMLEAIDYYKRSDDFEEGYKNDKVTSFRHIESGIRVELVRGTYMQPDDMLESFDFTVTQFAYYKDYEEDEDGDEVARWKIMYHNRFFEHLFMKRLVVDKDALDLTFPFSTYNRMFKYGEYGYFPCRETKVKVVQAMLEAPEFDEDMIAMGLYRGLD